MVIFLDGADAILENINNPLIGGFTTNPSILLKAGIVNYETFAKNILKKTGKPVALEVLSDDFSQMKRQALKLASWAENVNVKIPITNTLGESSIPLIADLIAEGVTVNVTCITQLKQVVQVLPVLNNHKGYISIFAGRIADTGRDPGAIIKKAVYLKQESPHVKLIWASAREALNVKQAENAGCDIITISSELLKKLSYFGRDLKDVSLDVVKMFVNDAKNFSL